MATDVVLVYVPVGGGHKAAAMAVAEAARARGLSAEVVNLFEHAPRIVAETYVASHVTGQTLVPRVYGYGYSAVNRRSGAFEPVRRGLDKMFFARIADAIEELEPRIVFATHHLRLVVLGRERLAGRMDAKLVGVITDYTSHAHWAEDGVDLFCVSCPSARAELVLHDVPAHRIALTGIPVRRAFQRVPPATDPAPGEKLRVLVTSGGFGVGPVRAIVRSFAGIRDVDLTVVCGASETLAHRLREDVAGVATKVTILGFEKDMAARIAEAHVVIGKAGGLTVSETLTAGRPMLVVGAVPGNEKRNECFVVEGGAGYAVDPRSAGAAVAGMRARREIGRLGATARRLVLSCTADHVLDAGLGLVPSMEAGVAA